MKTTKKKKKTVGQKVRGLLDKGVEKLKEIELPESKAFRKRKKMFDDIWK